MSAYFKAVARPVLSVLDAAELRAEPSVLLRDGMIAVFESPGLFRVLAEYSEGSTVADDGVTVWKPDDIAALDPGRWEIFGGESAGPHTYVKRKVDGSIDGLTADFSNPVVRVNFDVGANDPVPAVLCGLSVDRGAVGGVERDRAALLWDEPGAKWHMAFSSTDDTVLTSTYISLVGGGFYARNFGSSGFVRMAENDAVTALIGANTRNLIKGTAGDVLILGDPAFGSSLLESDGDVLIRSNSADIELRTREFQLFDAAGVNQLVSANPTSDFFRVIGDLQVYDGGTSLLNVDASAREFQFDNGATPFLRGFATSALLGLFGTLRFADTGFLSNVDLRIGSVPTTTDATATTVATIPVPASGAVTVFCCVNGTQSDGSNGFEEISVNSARRSGAAAPTLSQGLNGITIATLENTYAIVKPSFQYVISGNDLLLQVVGKAATTINWVPFFLTVNR